jgi:predicted RNase H-like nuclease
LLKQAGIDLKPLTSIDLVDAALCALTAHLAASGTPCRLYGEETEGLIVVPTTFIPPRLNTNNRDQRTA